MRRWIAALAFVPALAWGDCLSHEARGDFTELAMLVADMQQVGVSERHMLEEARQAGAPGTEAAMLEAVKLIYSPSSVTLSTVVTHMQRACDNATRQPPPR
jgi:hypothetical protein